MAQASSYSYAELYNIARNQRRILAIVLCWFLFTIPGAVMLLRGPAGASLGGSGDNVTREMDLFVDYLMLTGIGFLILKALAIVFLVLLLTALRASIVWAVIAVFGALVPYLSLVVLLIASHRATRALTNAGYSVGLLGVSPRMIRQLKDASVLPSPLTA